VSTDPEPIEYPTRSEILEIHKRALEGFGGRLGVREPEAIDAVLAPPEQLRAYGDDDDIGLSRCAAAIAAGFCRIRHPFVDGNKRVAFAAAAYTLFLNGYELDVSEADATRWVLGLSAGELDEEAFAAWLTANIVPLIAPE
jgi:death-on-curing protein